MIEAIEKVKFVLLVFPPPPDDVQLVEIQQVLATEFLAQLASSHYNRKIVGT